MTNKTCPLCKCEGRKIILENNFYAWDINSDVFSARRKPDRLHYEMAKCGCGLVYATETVDNLPKLYEESKFNYDDLVPYMRKTYLELIDMIPVRGNYLEIGCGNGFMFDSVRDLGYDKVVGIEPSEDCARQDDRVIKGMFSADLVDDKFDMVAAFQVLDHVPEPHKFISDCVSVMKDSGYLLMVMHDIGSWQAKILGKRNPMYDVEHPILYNKETIVKLLSLYDLSVLGLISIANEYPLHYWLKLLGIKSSVGVTIALKAGNMAVVAGKK
jgi:SAM-dependent methyltransferase